MRSIPQALLWEMFSNGRWTIPGFFLVGNALPLVMCQALSGYSVDWNDPAFIVLQFAFLPLIVIQFGVGIGVAQGPISKLYTAPIGANALVAWRTLFGAILIGLETALSTWVYNSLFGVNWPILGATLFAIAVWSAFQFVFCISIEKSVVSAFTAFLPTIGVCLWLKSRYGGIFSMPSHSWPEVTTTEWFTLFGLIVAFYSVNVLVLKRARCGEPLPTLGIWSWIFKMVEHWESNQAQRPPFRSAAEAQFWYDWRLKGLWLPAFAASLFIVVGIAGVASWYQNVKTASQLYESFLFCGGFISALAVVAGFILGMFFNLSPVGQREQQLGDMIESVRWETMGSFLGTRPATNQDYARSILKTAAQSVLIAWSLWFVGIVTFVLILWQSHQLPVPLIPVSFGLWYLPLTILGPWIVMSNVAMIGLSCRGSQITVAAITAIIGYLVAHLALKEFYSESFSNQVHDACTTIGSLLVVVASVWAFAKAARSKLLGNQGLIASTAVGVVVAIGAILLRPPSLSILSYPLIFAFASLVVLPVALMPLAISWGRHR